MNFRSYTITVDFEGLELPLPNTCRYVTRDEYGFVHGWMDKPKVHNFGGFSNGEEMPITFGHCKDWVGSPRVVRKYRRRGNTGLIAITGAVE